MLAQIVQFNTAEESESLREKINEYFFIKKQIAHLTKREKAFKAKFVAEMGNTNSLVDGNEVLLIRQETPTSRVDTDKVALLDNCKDFYKDGVSVKLVRG